MSDSEAGLLIPDGIGGPVCDRRVALESVRMGSEGFIEGGLSGLETQRYEARGARRRE